MEILSYFCSLLRIYELLSSIMSIEYWVEQGKQSSWKIDCRSKKTFFLASDLSLLRWVRMRRDNKGPVHTVWSKPLQSCITMLIFDFFFNVFSVGQLISTKTSTKFFTGYSFWDWLRIFLHKFTWSVSSVHKLNKLGNFW